MVLIWISLMTNSVGHFSHAYLCFLLLHFFLGVVFVPITHLFFNWIYLILLNFRVLYIFWIQVLYQVCFCTCFYPVYSSSFNFFHSILWRAGVFNFDELERSHLFVSFCVLCVSSQNSWPNIKSQNVSPWFCFEGFITCGKSYGSGFTF